MREIVLRKRPSSNATKEGNNYFKVQGEERLILRREENSLSLSLSARVCVGGDLYTFTN